MTDAGFTGTPGPWRYEPHNRWRGWSGFRIVATDDEGYVLVLAEYETTYHDAEADAALIAAAPDLYEALSALAALDDGDNPSLWPHAEVFEKAHAALAKAHGPVSPQTDCMTEEKST